MSWRVIHGRSKSFPNSQRNSFLEQQNSYHTRLLFCVAHSEIRIKSLKSPPPTHTSIPTMGRKDKSKQQTQDEKPGAEKNAANAKGGKKEQVGKEEKQKGGKKGKK
ncbi:hypothetical protein P3T76_003055 [Phytophthora citrophthora]|uniref:Uncharacterized protein n=1 Tax=Phytophthora citrophthora TaxID=4793 RepID=A0AAD9GWE0_9STRA|nr:hypothetical protein P3T76_003055 [Phytophthora citrophthora]